MGVGAVIAAFAFGVVLTLFVINYFKKKKTAEKTGVGVNDQDQQPGGPTDDPSGKY